MPTKKPKYTEKVHRKRLIMLLKHKDIDWRCPAGKNYMGNDNERWSTPQSKVCSICLSFVDITAELATCPCIHFGEEQARSITLNKLKELGDL